MLMILSIMDPIAKFFGWITRCFYHIFGNYGLAIIALTVLIRVVMIPLNIKSEKSMLKTQALSSKMAEAQRKYGNDKEAYQQEVMRIQQESGAGGFAGCLLPLLQIFVLWPVYQIVSRPLSRISNVSEENIIAMGKLAGMDEKAVIRDNVTLITKLTKDGELLKKCVQNGYLKMDQLMNFDFFGLDLRLKPSFRPDVIASNKSQYIPLLIIPILVIVTQILSMKLTEWLKPGYKEEKLAKERAKKNPAKSVQEVNPAEQSTKIMMWTFPVLMLITTFTTPAAFGIYWIVASVMAIITQFLVYWLFKKPYALKKKELELKKANAFKKKDKADKLDPDSDENNLKKKKKKKIDIEVE
ncbi:MAG: YidC/Oxa1 family membrane protein insertase [Clostridia bacterium]|nr:YidC/Oxa1 family membrane protein insertase [Clostridia bacterium]